MESLGFNGLVAEDAQGKKPQINVSVTPEIEEAWQGFLKQLNVRHRKWMAFFGGMLLMMNDPVRARELLRRIDEADFDRSLGELLALAKAGRLDQPIKGAPSVPAEGQTPARPAPGDEPPVEPNGAGPGGRRGRSK